MNRAQYRFLTLVTASLLLVLGCGDKKQAADTKAAAAKAPVKKRTPKALPLKLGLDTPVVLVARVKQVSKIPDPETLDYDDLITTVKLTVANLERGKVDGKEVLVQFLAIRDRQRLSPAGLKVNQKLRLYLVPWSDTIESIKSLQQVDDVQDFELTPYFAAAHVDLDNKPGEDPKRIAAVAASRKAAIGETRGALDAELKKYGDGSYDKWLENLAPFYADMKKQSAAITRETARKGEYGPFKKNGLSSYRSLYKELLSLPLDEHPALKQIVAFARALEQRGIDLIYVSLPRPHLVYPDYIADVELPHLMVAPRYREQLKYLVDHGVEVVDTLPFILANRDGEMGRMYTETSHHPTNVFMRRFAEMTAERLERYGLSEHRFEVLAAEEAPPDHGTPVLKVIYPDGKPFKDAKRSSVLVIGDSTIRLNWPSPSAGYSGHLSRLVGVRTKMVQRNSFGLSALAKEPADLFDGVKVVVWVQWSLFLGKPYARDNWWKTPIDWSKTRVLGS